MLLLGEGSEMFSNIFWIREEGSVYFNIREEESVIQTSLRGGECNLLNNYWFSKKKYNGQDLIHLY